MAIRVAGPRQPWMPLRRIALSLVRLTPAVLHAVLRQPPSAPLRTALVDRYVRWAYQAIDAGHERAALSLLDPQIEVRDPPALPDAAVYRGHQGVLEDLEKFREIWDYSYEVAEIVDAGNLIMVTFRFPGRARLGGIEFEAEWAHLWTVRDGRVVRLEWFPDAEEARAKIEA